MEEESVADECYRPLSAEEEGGDGSDAFGPGGDEFGDEFEDGELGVESDAEDNFGDSFFDKWEERAVDSIAELGCINFKEITAKEILMCHFLDRSVAFLFYSLYAKMNGFAVRKNKIWRNVRNEVTQQEFGFRGMGSVNDGMQRKREPKAETRCGCEVEMCVHVHFESGRWIISYFQDVHNHKLLDDRLTFMLSGHRKMDAATLEQMNMMPRDGIKTPQIYSSFVQTARGFQNLSFLKRDMYNQIGKYWRLIDHWHYMVDALGLSDNQWVSDLYSRRRMWATAHIRGNFFGGFRTMSRCEGLHSMLGKFVQSRHNLRDFVEQFMRCISQMRSREAHSDLLSMVGEPVLQSPFHDLERSAAKKLTRAIFFNFRPMLFRACTLKVRTHTWSQTSDTFTLSRSANARREWQVCHYGDSNNFKCSCLRMESLGIPCDPIVAVLVHLEMTDIPDSLVLDHWSKSARSKVRAFVEKGLFCWDISANI
ncbi:hypothetical protein Ahy_B02g058877 [Arachis hypogaea]|uniref:SWIM-type domain-containing protein n=1 Tax=Arachis hypogaea TaxID=3818 RepID=A0A445AFM0_ARAHY|nr:hypothetical protein Ahy_B02g058877 [Arachis hypogaea]